MPHFDPYRAAKVLVDAFFINDARAARKHKVSVSSIYNWRKRLEWDREFATIFKFYLLMETRKHDTELIDYAITQAVGYIGRFCATAQPTAMNALAVAKCLETLHTIKTTDAFLSKKLGAIGESGKESRPSHPGHTTIDV
jgi:uncharacterized protein involved in tolerance to divalent cations